MIDVCCSGGPWTEKEQLRVDETINNPSMIRWLIYFMEDPQRISEYMAANCSTATVGGDSRIEKLQTDDFGYFLGNAFNFLLD
jgi:hypothetical protein